MDHILTSVIAQLEQHGTYISGPLKYEVSEGVQCSNYFTILDLFNYDCKLHVLDNLAQICAGVAGCMMLPTVTFGLVANSLLALLLATKVKRPGQMHIYALVLAIFDVLFLVQGGYFFAFLTFGRPWWGSTKRLLSQSSHMACKLFNLFFDFLQCVRSFLQLIMVSHVLNVADRPHTASTRPVVIWAQIVAVLAVATIFASPSGLIHGMHQRAGQMNCAPDPQWAQIVHQFHSYHVNLFIVGLIPNTLTIALLCLVWRRFCATKKMLAYLQNLSIQRDPVGLILCYLEHQQSDWIQNYHILLIQGSCFSLLRIARCLTKLFYFTIIVKLTHYPTDSSVQSVTALTNVNMPVFLELIMSSFPFMLWYVNIPQIRAHCESLWLRFTCRWTPRQLRRFQQRLHPGSYLDQALQMLGGREMLEMKCEHVFKQMREQEKSLRVKYDWSSGPSMDSRLPSIVDSSTVMTTGSFFVSGPRGSRQSVNTEQIYSVSLSSYSDTD